MTKEALTLALEALHGFIPYLPLNDEAQCGRYDQAITAVKEALAQPEQEQQIETLKRCLFQMQEAAKDLVEQAKSLTPPQRTWVGLDLDERAACYEKSGGNLSKFADQIESKLREKNT